jgi:putative MATE family efflux protein
MMFSNRDLKKLIIPLIIDQILMLSVGLADSIMVARVGEAAISAVALVDTISILIIWFFSALGTGGAVVAAQFIGSGSIEKARDAGKQLILVTVLLSVLIMTLCLIFNNTLLRLIFGNVESGVMSGARTYFFYCALSYPFIALYNAGAAIFRAARDSKTPTVYSAVMNGVNIVFNAIFIFGCGWGVAGAGLATLMGRAFACIATLFSLTMELLNNNLRYYKLVQNIIPAFKWSKRGQRN